MWIMISNMLDIDFIHGDIHYRSCKKGILIIWNMTEIYLKIWPEQNNEKQSFVHILWDILYLW